MRLAMKTETARNHLICQVAEIRFYLSGTDIFLSRQVIRLAF